MRTGAQMIETGLRYCYADSIDDDQPDTMCGYRLGEIWIQDRKIAFII